ncbi:MAG: gliding motility lipoprotein GldD [Flavobacteriales bacterium]|nr:gliding motility lipoprotein GldD [Flavobacteriales bacterium]
MKKLRNRTLIVFCVFCLFSCEEEYSPKPLGYFRIDLPEHTYKHFSPENCPYSFDINKRAFIDQSRTKDTEPCWVNVHYPRFKSTIHISYKEVKGDLKQFLEDSRTLVYKHTAKASDIQERLVINDSSKVYGLVYFLEGNAASSMQFYLTDSTNHFLRGALYFNAKPNPDSIAPVQEFIRQDIIHFIESFKWKAI